jgi:hypothetical protein
MNKTTVYHWLFGAAIFVGLVGFWAWHLPSTLQSAQSPKDEGLQKIMSTFRSGLKNTGGDLANVRNEMEKGLQNINSSLEAQKAQAAVGAMKDKIELESKIKEALKNQNANANVNVGINANINVPAKLPAAPAKKM